PNDATFKRIGAVMDSFDDLELKVESRVIRPRYVDARLVMDTLVMRGLANIWRLTEETSTATWTEGKNTMQAVSKRPAFMQTALVTTGAAPVPSPPKVPYVYEVPSRDPFEVPKTYTGSGLADQLLVSFNNMSSTEQRGGIVAVGTLEDLEGIQAF